MSEVIFGIIGGTGLGESMLATGQGARHEIDTPFGRPSDAIVEMDMGGVRVLCLWRHGPGHMLGPSQVPYRANIFALKQLGCTHVIASGAIGSLREEFKPGDLVIADQIIDKTRRAGSFFENAAVHVEFAEPFCPVLRQMLLEAGKNMPAGNPQQGAPAYTIHDRGCYVAMEGPAFSTRAESLMHRLWGGDLIGMTAMPEAKLAREAEMSYALVGLVTDYDSWRTKPAADKPADSPALLEEIRANLKAASERASDLIRKTIELAATGREELLAAAAQRSLQLAIWSDRTKIAPAEIERLKPLWGRYFESMS